jgi:hypothetical protein
MLLKPCQEFSFSFKSYACCFTDSGFFFFKVNLVDVWYAIIPPVSNLILLIVDSYVRLFTVQIFFQCCGTEIICCGCGSNF